MSDPRSFPTLLSLLMLMLTVAVPAIAMAQTVEIKGQPGATVLAVTDAGRVPLGTLNASGELEVPVRLLDRGTQFEVVLETVPERSYVVLVERGRVDPICDAPPPTRVTCVRTGTFINWGRVERIRVNESGQVTVEGEADRGAGGLRWKPGVIASAETARTFVSGDDRLCREASRFVDPGIGFVCDTASSTDAFGASIGVTVLRMVSLQAAYLDVGRLEFQLSGTSDGAPVSVNGRLDRTRGPMFTAAIRADVGWPVVPFVEAGAWRWSTNVRAEVSANGAPFAVNRSLGGWAPVIGGGVEFWPVRHVGFHAGVKWIRLDEELSDLNGLLNRDDRFTMATVGLRFAIR